MITIRKKGWIHLPVLRKAHHQLWDAKWKLITSVYFPHMKSLAVGGNKLLHGGMFHHIGNAEHDEFAALNLIVMTMPKALLGGVQGLEDLLADNLFNAD